MIPASKTPLLQAAFSRYTQWYLRRSFHAVHLLGEIPTFPDNSDLPLIVCMNHSSWWDVLLGLYCADTLFGWEWYGVMDARQLERYRFFARLGMIGVDRTSLHGAKEFLTYTEHLLKGKRRALWLTPQGEMLSNALRPVHFQPGIGHLALALEDFYITTVALHYEFWNERLPETFIALSPLERVTVGANFDRRAFVRQQEARLQDQMDALALLAQQRNAANFRPLLTGKSGISTTYDLLRSVGARLRGERFRVEHGDIATPQWKKDTRR